MDIPWYFVAVELFVYALTIWCLFSAGRKGLAEVTTLLVSIVFGFAVELYFVLSGGTAGYHYNAFLVMIGPVPLWVSLGWGSIIYGAMRTTDHFTCPWGYKPFADGLLAANIDFVLDPIAAELKWWVWQPDDATVEQGLDWAYFGIPWDNFLGWMMIVSSLSLTIRAGYRWFPPGSKGKLGTVLVPIVATIPSLVLVVIEQTVFDWMYGTPLGQPLTFVFFYGLAALAVVFTVPRLSRQVAPDWYVLAVPMAMMAFLFGLFFVTLLYDHVPALLVVIPAMWMLSAFWYSWPYLDKMLPSPPAP